MGRASALAIDVRQISYNGVPTFRKKTQTFYILDDIGSIGLAEPINFQRWVLKSINFEEIQ